MIVPNDDKSDINHSEWCLFSPQRLIGDDVMYYDVP